MYSLWLIVHNKSIGEMRFIKFVEIDFSLFRVPFPSVHLGVIFNCRVMLLPSFFLVSSFGKKLRSSSNVNLSHVE